MRTAMRRLVTAFFLSSRAPAFIFAATTTTYAWKISLTARASSSLAAALAACFGTVVGAARAASAGFELAWSTGEATKPRPLFPHEKPRISKINRGPKPSFWSFFEVSNSWSRPSSLNSHVARCATVSLPRLSAARLAEQQGAKTSCICTRVCARSLK